MNDCRSLNANTLLAGCALQPPVAERVLGHLIRRLLFCFFHIQAIMGLTGSISKWKSLSFGVNAPI